MGAAKESISTINSLLLEVAGHLEVGKPAGERAAFEKLRRISALATTLALTVKLSR